MAVVKIAFATVAPSSNFLGKYLITQALEEEGVFIINLGERFKGCHLLSFLKANTPDVLAFSCPDEECLSELFSLLSIASGRNIPVICGGSALSIHHATNFRKKLHYPLIYYSHGPGDVSSVLRCALKKEIPPEPSHGKGIPLPLSPEEKQLVHCLGLRVLSASFEDIVIKEGTRQWCGDCLGNLNRTCPLSSGYFSQKTILESHQYIQRYKKVFLICSPILKKEERENMRDHRKTLWLGLKELEKLWEKRLGETIIFKLPIRCPLCAEEQCLMPQARCHLPELQFPMHEEYNIDMMETARAIAGDSMTMEMYSLVLADPLPNKKIH
jgi:hypothetical protein